VQGLIIGGDVEQAKKEADRLQAVYGAEALWRAFSGLEQDQLPRAVPVIEYSYPASPTPKLNFIFAVALSLAGRLQEASALIASQQNPKYAAASYGALQIAAFHSGDYDLSSEAGRQALERTKEPTIAYNIACAEARAGRADEALAWIERAVEMGYRNVDAMVSDSDLETLRSRPEFKAVCDRLREVAV
jgi:uncharacterized membrane-anchored protein